VKIAIIKLIPSFERVLGLNEFGRKIFPLANSWLPDLNSSESIPQIKSKETSIKTFFHFFILVEISQINFKFQKSVILIILKTVIASCVYSETYIRSADKWLFKNIL
jgi:hypothetical protein